MMPGVLAAVVVALVVLILALSRPSPTRTARKRLDAQLTAVRSQLATLQLHDRGYVAQQEETVRQQWRHDQLTRPVDSLDVPGFGEAMFETLRESGITKLEDVVLLRRKKVPGIGQKRAAQLWSTYQEELARLEAEARALD